MKIEVQIDVQDLDHLGIIAGIVDEIGIVEIINKEIVMDAAFYTEPNLGEF